ncbi:MAG: pirin family protein [Thermoplasmata archaeon]|nr:pirin family protein [Thermoplasmata archaeon]
MSEKVRPVTRKFAESPSPAPSAIRSVSRKFEGAETLEGAGVRLRRMFSGNEVPLLDPFLLLDNFGSSNPADYLAGFPWHPHRGIETVTYMLKGRVEHQDSLGNGGTIASGDVQWMSAGSGILHQEMPQRTEGRLSGFQLWVNLPRRLKMEVPAYRGLHANGIPVVRTPEGGIVKVVAGSFEGVEGPVREIPVDPTYLDVTLPAETGFSTRVQPGHTVFAQAFEGAGEFDPFGPSDTIPFGPSDTIPLGPSDTIPLDPPLVPRSALGRGSSARAGETVLFGAGDQVQIRAGAAGLRFLLVAGKPLREPVAWYGPIVMNTREEILEAERDLERGTFIRDKQVVSDA